jgi:hypothetical protein
MDTKRYRELITKNRPIENHEPDHNESTSLKQKKLVGILSYLSENKNHVKLNDGTPKLGKNPQSDILVKGFAVGKTAAVINKCSDGWYISYVGGLSKVRVNRKILKSPCKLHNFDIIAIGSTRMQFMDF